MYGSCDEIIEKIKDKYIIEISADIPYKNIYSKFNRTYLIFYIKIFKFISKKINIISIKIYII